MLLTIVNTKLGDENVRKCYLKNLPIYRGGFCPFLRLDHLLGSDHYNRVILKIGPYNSDNAE